MSTMVLVIIQRISSQRSAKITRVQSPFTLYVIMDKQLLLLLESDAQADILATMDGDLQNDPHDIPMMLEKVEELMWFVDGGKTVRIIAYFEHCHQELRTALSQGYQMCPCTTMDVPYGYTKENT